MGGKIARKLRLLKPLAEPKGRPALAEQGNAALTSWLGFEAYPSRGCVFGSGIMGRATARRTEIRVLSPGSIEDFHAHLVRLDRTSRFPGEDDHAIDTHCLGLVSVGAILI